MKSKVFVGMSGGVDSSVAAALLKERGYEVVGVFIKTWEPSEEEVGIKCSWREERRDAMRVAAKLNIPLLTVDLGKEYKQRVVDYMLKEYAAGRTPNPDVMCNREIKFGAFYDWAIKYGADYIATGHYVRLDTRDRMLVAKDRTKDQSYFLWTLRYEQLKHCLFPIGDYQKALVRQLARKFNLPTASKKDSQGLCFIGPVDLKVFLKTKIKPKKGEVVNLAGKVIGKHEGVFFYTIGERHGFKIDDGGVASRPLYVVAKDLRHNRLIVSPNPAEKSDQSVTLEQTNWLVTDEPDLKLTYQARIRYRAKLFSGKLVKADGKWQFQFKLATAGLTSGQSLVVYRGEQMIGGGIIA